MKILSLAACALLLTASSAFTATPRAAFKSTHTRTALAFAKDAEEVTEECRLFEVVDELADIDDVEEMRAALVAMGKSTDCISDEAVIVSETNSVTGKETPILYSNKEGRGMSEGIFKFNKTLIDFVYEIICFLYPVKGTDRDYARFYVLETVARVPYFAYLSVLHLRETFGQRYDGEDNLKTRMRTHYAEADNEMHHLLIMESLGGNSNAIDRALAQTMAFFYYWYVVSVFAFSEPAAYHLSELIEDHAFNTYNKYLTEHAEMLKTKPVPAIAHEYYEEEDLFLFDLLCTVKDVDEEFHIKTRRPKLESLYDVFINVREDEKEHWKTLCNLVQFNDMHGADNQHVRSTEPIRPIPDGGDTPAPDPPTLPDSEQVSGDDVESRTASPRADPRPDPVETENETVEEDLGVTASGI